jgi:hypothetical protein
MIPTKEEYEKALATVRAYENDIKKTKIESSREFIKEMTLYFKSLNIGIEELSLSYYNNKFYMIVYDKNGNEFYVEFYDGEYD